MIKVKQKRANHLNPTQGELRNITKAFSQLLVITIAEEPSKVKKLLQLHGAILSQNPTDRELIAGLIDKIADQDQRFNNNLALLIEMTLPDLSTGEQYDNFGELFKFGGDTRIAGGSGGSAIFGGSAGIGSSSGSSLVDGASTIGKSTASGAAGGGILGGILGAVGGIFNHSATVKQQKIEKDKAASKVFSDLLQFKRGGGNGTSKTGTYVLVGVSMLVLIGIILVVAKNQSKKVTT